MNIAEKEKSTTMIIKHLLDKKITICEAIYQKISKIREGETKRCCVK